MPQDDHLHEASSGGQPPGSAVSDAARLNALAAAWTWETDSTCVTTVVGAGVARLLGRDPTEMRGRPVFDHMPADEAVRGRQLLDALGHSPRLYGFVRAVFQHRDGHLVHIEVTGQPVFDDQGRHVGYRGIARDVTPQRERLRQLTEEAARWRLLFDHSKDGIVVLDRSGRVREANQRYCEMLGYTREELLRLSLWDFDAIHAREDLERRAGSVSPGGEEFETVHRRKDGTRYDVAVASSVVEWAGEELIQCLCRDITTQTRARQRLATQAAVARVLAEATTIEAATPRVIQALCETEGWSFGSIFVVDPFADRLLCAEIWHDPALDAGDLVAASRAFTFARGVGLPGRVWERRQPLMVGDVRADPSYLRRANAVRAGLVSALAIPVIHQGEVLAVIDFLGRDIREPDDALLDMLGGIGAQVGQFLVHRRAEEALRRFVDASPVAIYALQLAPTGSLRFGWASENVTAMTGYRVGERLDLREWVGRVHAEDRQRVLEAHAAPYTVDHQVLEFRLRRHDGSVMWVRDEKRLLRDAAGTPREVVGSWSDVTHRVHLEDQLRQAQKMEAVGQLAGGVAHDFNNLLTVIAGNVEMLAATLAPDDARGQHVQDVSEAADRASALTRQLLAFSRRQVLEPRLLDLNGIVAGVEKMLRRLIGENIVLYVALAPALPQVKVDPSQLEQALINLALNARDAMPNGGRLEIGTSIADLSACACEGRKDRRPGTYCRLSVRDTGCGMSSDVLAHVFEPFFTTKDVGKGTGLGLSSVYGLVTQSGGFVDVTSEVGIGTTFHIALPAGEGEDADGPAREAAAAPPPGHETILVVEDDPAVRRIARLVLERRGYDVHEAGGAAQALELAASLPQIHLLLSDVVMPGMSGPDLVRRLRGLCPRARVLFMSGYIDDAVTRHGVLGLGSGFLQKPFTADGLSHKVRELLDA